MFRLNHFFCSVVLSSCLSAPSFAAVLSGVVLERGSREPVAGVDIVAGEYETQTDEQGRFELSLPEGTHALKLWSPSHRPETAEVQLSTTETEEHVFRMTPLAVPLFETTVRGASNAGDATRVQFRAEEMTEMAGTMGDPLKALMNVPGAGAVAAGLGYPAVRGTTPAATGYFVDGMRLPALYHLLLGHSLIHPSWVDRVDFQPGAAPVSLSRLLGGAVEVRTRKPAERAHYAVSADLMTLGAFMEVPASDLGVGLVAAGRFSHTGLVGGLVASLLEGGDDASLSPNVIVWDAQVRATRKLPVGELAVTFLGARDKVVLPYDSHANGFEGELRLGFLRLDASWTAPVGGGEFELGLTGGRDEVGAMVTLASQADGALVFREQSLRLRSVWKRDAGDWSWQLGGDVEGKRASSERSGSIVPVDGVLNPYWRANADGFLGGLFGATTWRPDLRWSLSFGARGDLYLLGGESPIFVGEPRVGARRELGGWGAWKAALGLRHAPPTVVLPLPASELLALDHGLQRALHLTTGLEWRLADFDFSVDAYVNPMLRTVEIGLREIVEGKQSQPWRGDELASTGVAWGAELLVRKAIGRRWSGWFSYGWQRSIRREGWMRFDAEGNAQERVVGWVPFPFEQQHVATLSGSWRFDAGWTVGSTWRFQTGRPESGVLTSQPQKWTALPDGGEDWRLMEPSEDPRLPAMLRGDLRISRRWHFDTWSLNAWLDVFNVTLAEETWFYAYATGVDSDGGPTPFKSPKGFLLVLPTVGVEGSW